MSSFDLRQSIIARSAALCALAIACMVCIPCCGKSDHWLTMKSGDVVLQYQPGMEKAAHTMLPELVKIANDPDALNRATMRAQLRTLSAKRKDILDYLAAHIGQAKPGPTMTQAYDGMVRSISRHSQLLSGFKRFRLWDREKLKAAARAGRVPVVAYDAAEDRFQPTLDVSFAVIRIDVPKGSSEDGAEKAPDSRMEYIPICHGKGESWRQSLAQWKKAVAWFCESARMSHSVFHEAVECGIVGDFGLQTAFRRWFCEGAANCVGELCIKEFFGQSTYEGALKLTDVAPYAALKPQVDLIGWPAMELQTSKSPNENLRDAHYNYATYEVRGLIERHGPDMVAGVMRELGKSKVRDSRAILDAIKAVTGEDIEPRLRGYGSQVKDEFRGLAVTRVEFAVSTPDGRGELKRLKSGDTVLLDGKRDLAVSFEYGVLDRPWKVRLDAVSPGTIYRANHSLKNRRNEWVWMGLALPKQGSKVKPGDYKLRLYFDDKLFREITIKVVNSAETR